MKTEVLGTSSICKYSLDTLFGKCQPQTIPDHANRLHPAKDAGGCGDLFLFLGAALFLAELVADQRHPAGHHQIPGHKGAHRPFEICP